MTTHDATLVAVEDESGRHVVVERADDVIWITKALMEEIPRPSHTRVSGEMTLNGDLIKFGTVGKGLGRLTYRIVGEDFERDIWIARREP